MTTLNIDGLIFTFPANWQASKYDDWDFYQKEFKRQNGIKAMDVVALSSENVAFFIEVKDYRNPRAVFPKPSELAQTIATKVVDTLAALLPAKLNAVEPHEKSMAVDILNCNSLQIFLHIEQPQNKSYIIDLADIQQKLKQRLRAIDKNPKVVSMNKMANLPWIVT